MTSNDVIWPEAMLPPAVKAWVVNFFAAADSKEDGSARRFADFFHDEGTMIGMTGPIQGKQGIVVP